VRHTLRLALALFVATLALPAAQAQNNGLTFNQPTAFTYRDGDGQGRLTVQDIGPDSVNPQARLIKVVLVQNGVQYTGSGITQLLKEELPRPTLISFTLIAPTGRSYFFQGTLISGITLSADGSYHRVGFPENRFRWNIVLGG
jgi:hypothetical protein